MSIGVAMGLPTPPPAAMRKDLKQRIEAHPYELSVLNPPPRSSSMSAMSSRSTLCSLPSSARLIKTKPHESNSTFNTSSSNTGSSVSFPSDYTSSSSAFSRLPIPFEMSDEDLLASAWRHPLGTVRAEPVPDMPLHFEDMRTQRSRGLGTWHIPSAETLCAQIGHDAAPQIHRCFLNAFMVPVASSHHFATTPCKRCNLPIPHDDESCRRCPARWLRDKTGVDETGWLGTRSRLLVDSKTYAVADARSRAASVSVFSPEQSYASQTTYI